jgi:hypothetical protein
MRNQKLERDRTQNRMPLLLIALLLLYARQNGFSAS